MGEPIGCTERPPHALREIARVLADGAILIASFDHRIACVDHYLEQGDPRPLADFLRTGRTQWLTRDPNERFELHTFELGELRHMLRAAGLEVLEVIGKTVLPMRRHRKLLEDPQQRREWLRIEQGLSRQESHLGRCAHLQIAARKLPG
jgi:hypothetical protein